LKGSVPESNYERQTRRAYRDRYKAAEYRRQHTDQLTWARFATAREKRGVAALLRLCDLGPQEIILDIPCGTGVLAETLAEFPFRVVAADISREMMRLAVYAYKKGQCRGFVQADITCPPFKNDAYGCVVVLGFMHRVPPLIRAESLRALCRLTERFLILSYSLDSPAQRFKRRMVRFANQCHRFAPYPLKREELRREVHREGLAIRKIMPVVPMLSSEVLLLLEKIPS